MSSDPCIAELRAEFALPLSELTRIADAFTIAMRAGLAGRPSPLRMLPSYLAPPSGQETGTFLAVDFGGTNVRLLEADLRGGTQPPHVRQEQFALVDQSRGRDFVSNTADAIGLFDYLAMRIAAFVSSDEPHALGLTFSFPCAQTAPDRARLIKWTKEFATRGVEGEDVGALFGAALRRAGLGHVQLRVILNDTVGTLLSAAYGDPRVDIGAICGTGHNACYVEQHHPLTDAPMVVNMESGNFDALPTTQYDAALDTDSERPGEQRLEKLVAGKYLGEVLRLVLCAWDKRRLLSGNAEGTQAARYPNAELVSALMQAEAEPSRTENVLDACFQWRGIDATTAQRVHAAAQCVAERSATLVAATIKGVAQHLDVHRPRAHVVAIDGSVYEKQPGHAELLQRTLDGLTSGHERITAIRAKDGSGIGAAIAAASVRDVHARGRRT